MNDFWKDSPELGARLDGVLAVMDEALRGPGFPLSDAVAGIARANGKLLRPALLVIGSRFGRAGAANASRIDSLAAAVELLHVATLIHDDVLDEASLRRGVATLHSRFGTKEAVLAGDWLFSRCFRLASESAGPGNARGLARLIGAICAAEIEQDLAKGRYSTSARRYFRTIAGKTAALFALALEVGAAEAKAPSRDAQALRRAGYDIGMAFQVIDDILDCESSEGAMGKPVGKDLREGLCTLPLVHALRAEESLPPGERALRPLLARLEASRRGEALTGGGDGPADEGSIVAALLARIADLGGLERSREAARLFTARARTEILALPAIPARAELSGLADRLLARSY